MRYLAEYRDADAVRRLADRIAAAATRDWTLMEVCGGQTHAILRFGLDQLLPPQVALLHGPGCPVCVTPEAALDKAMEIAGRGAILCSFSDMMRVPGSAGDLFAARARGADVRMVAAPVDAVAIARDNPGREVVLFAVGFETTAPAQALAVLAARRAGLANFSLLSALVLVPPALGALLGAPDNRVQGFLAAGHVCAVTGTAGYAPIARAHRVPVVVTGFEPVDILAGVLACVQQLEAGRAEVENRYARAVRDGGNAAARAMLAEVFEPVGRVWRGLGTLPDSGLGLRPAFRDLDAEVRFGPVAGAGDRAAGGEESGGPCLSGAILRGAARPTDCPAFGRACTPEQPLGPTMVSSEGACAAYWRYRGAA